MKRYKVLTTNKFKGKTQPPLMSVIVTEMDDRKTQRIVDCKKVKFETMSYKIVESQNGASTQMGQFWADRSLLMDAPRRPKQIHIVIQLAKVQSIKEIDARVHEGKKVSV